MNTWARWQQVHPGSSYQDYQNWWTQYGQQGATIQPDVPKKGGGFDLGKTLNSIGKVAMTVAPVVAAVLGTSMTGAGAAPDGINPMWLTLAQVLDEVVAGFRATGLPARSDQQTFLRVVEHLAHVARDLAQSPSDPALLAEYHELSEFLSAHPDSAHLAAFIETHPSIVPTVVATKAATAAGAIHGSASAWGNDGREVAQEAFQAYTNPTGTAVHLASDVFSAFTAPKKGAIDALGLRRLMHPKVDLNDGHFHPLGGGRFLNDISHRVYNAATQTWE